MEDAEKKWYHSLGIVSHLGTKFIAYSLPFIAGFGVTGAVTGKGQDYWGKLWDGICSLPRFLRYHQEVKRDYLALTETTEGVEQVTQAKETLEQAVTRIHSSTDQVVKGSKHSLNTVYGTLDQARDGVADSLADTAFEISQRATDGSWLDKLKVIGDAVYNGQEAGL